MTLKNTLSNPKYPQCVWLKVPSWNLEGTLNVQGSRTVLCTFGLPSGYQVIHILQNTVFMALSPM